MDVPHLWTTLRVDHRRLDNAAHCPQPPQAPTARRDFISGRNERKGPSGFQEIAVIRLSDSIILPFALPWHLSVGRDTRQGSTSLYDISTAHAYAAHDRVGCGFSRSTASC